jgi:hypothetical protein
VVVRYNEGTLVGIDIGVKVGIEIGVKVGDKEGVLVGIEIGVKDGYNEGAIVGITVFAIVGIILKGVQVAHTFNNLATLKQGSPPNTELVALMLQEFKPMHAEFIVAVVVAKAQVEVANDPHTKRKEIQK